MNDIINYSTGPFKLSRTEASLTILFWHYPWPKEMHY